MTHKSVNPLISALVEERAHARNLGQPLSEPLSSKAQKIKQQWAKLNGTKKSSKLYGIRSTALKAIEQWRNQAVVLDAASWKRSPTAGGYAIAVPCSRQWNQMYKLSKNFC